MNSLMPARYSFTYAELDCTLLLADVSASTQEDAIILPSPWLFSAIDRDFRRLYVDCLVASTQQLKINGYDYKGSYKELTH